MKILVLTSLYPVKGNNTNTTPVVHSFTKEWVKKGHEVIVVLNENKFPFPFYLVPQALKDLLEAKLGVRIPKLHQRRKISYLLEGVKVFRLPILKVKPFGQFSKKKINKQTEEVIRILKSNNFHPAIIVGHWENPQIPMINLLKKEYPKTRTSIVFHDINYAPRYSSFLSHLKGFDTVGFRSLGIKRKFVNQYGDWGNFFLCYSGLPDHYIESNKIKYKQFNNPITRFIYVGLLISRKYPEILVTSLIKRRKKTNFTIEYIGEGKLKKKIRNVALQSNIGYSIHFYGKIPREEVLKVLSKAECLIMISKSEAFGLVYLEAMLKGCLVIASYGEGMDGIIENQFNGFLCEAGNRSELTRVLNTIDEMPREKLQKISRNAIKTAIRLSDSKVASQYLYNIS